MDVYTLFAKWKQFVVKLNTYGVPAPTIRDPKTKIGSVSLTLLFISSLLVIIGLIGKWSGKLGGIDISNALEFFYATSALYFGRAWVSKTGAKADLPIENPPESNPK